MLPPEKQGTSDCVSAERDNSASRWLRIVLGCVAIATSFLVAASVGMLQQINYNTWYGDASQQLVQTTLRELEANHTPQVIENLKLLDVRFHPSYENRGSFDKIVKDYVDRLNKSRRK